ncbi:MAG: peptide chain release factor N(5)-glutamine methyltransferase [Litorimonas sp.]
MVTPLDQRPRSGPYSGLNARSAKRFLTQAFSEAGLPFAEEDALEIVLAATGFDKTALMLRGAEFLEPEVSQTIRENMSRRLSGEPVDHILGWREFFGRRFQISGDVLSPRADTETLIRGALTRLNQAPKTRLLDMGTGSGAIGLTLLAERQEAELLSTDLSDSALEIAKINARSLNVASRVSFACGSWWEAVPTDRIFDMILSNPPYITDAAMENLETEVIAYDPDLALRGGTDGLDAYRIIIEGAPTRLELGGWLGLEIGFDQAKSVTTLLKTGVWDAVSVEKDLSGLARAIWARKIT